MTQCYFNCSHSLHNMTFSFFFFFNDTATTEIYTLSLHDALPIDPTGKGHGAEAIASIGGGTAKVTVADGKTLPTGDVTWVFSRKATDYATTAITNLWYSWAKYYHDQFTNVPPPNPISGDLVFKDINTGGPGNT